MRRVLPLPNRCPGCGLHLTTERQLIWTPAAILDSARAWTIRYGNQPTAHQWRNGTPDHPPKTTVVYVFGSWGAMIAAAGYEPKGRGAVIWTRERIIEAMLDWVAVHGRWPTVRDWNGATVDRPHWNTVIRLFGSWNACRRAACYTGSGQAKTRSASSLARAAASVATRPKLAA
jgi:hypothetical protein